MTKFRLPIIAFLFLASAGTLLFLDPIAQDLDYHNFADERMFFGIPNFWNVASNLPFLFLGFFGLRQSFKNWSSRPDFVTKWLPVVLCVGFFTAFFGSSYYHWIPDNISLAWDRLPMTLMFMPLLALLIYDFVGKEIGRIAFFVLIPLGVFSVFYWQYTETIGQGDLRLYAFVQFFPMFIVPFVLWLFPKKVNYIRYIWLILGWYILAKLCEHFDDVIFDTLQFWSGHTIKHLLGGVSIFYILKMVESWERELID